VKFRESDEVFMLDRSSWDEFWSHFWSKVRDSSLKDRLNLKYISKCEVKFKYDHVEVRMFLGNEQDLRVVYEVFCEEVYKDLDVKDKCVIDIGTYIGDTAIYFVLRGAKKVIAVEPYPFSYSLAKKNIRTNNMLDKVLLINAAVASEYGKIRLSCSPSDAESILKSSENGIEVPIMTIKDLLSLAKDYIADSYSVLKIDCEGCEYDLILNSSPQMFTFFNEVMLEYHNDPRPLIKKLKELGFKLIKLKVSNEHLGIIYARRL